MEWLTLFVVALVRAAHIQYLAGVEHDAPRARPVTLYETARGDFAPASSLTPEEAVAAHEHGHLLARDWGSLTPIARATVEDHVGWLRAIDPSALEARETTGGRLVLVGVWERGSKRTRVAVGGVA